MKRFSEDPQAPVEQSKISPCRCEQNSRSRSFLIASAMQDYAKVQYYIEEAGLHPDSSYGGKPTAICYAVMKADTCLMKYLHRKGASLNICDKLGMTPVHYAVLGGSCFCISYLLRSGAAINVPTLSGKTPLALAIDNPQLSRCKSLLIKHGGRVFSVPHNPDSIH